MGFGFGMRPRRLIIEMIVAAVLLFSSFYFVATRDGALEDATMMQDSGW